MENGAARTDDLTATDIREPVFSVPRFATCPVTGDGKDTIFEAAHRHAPERVVSQVINAYRDLTGMPVSRVEQAQHAG